MADPINCVHCGAVFAVQRGPKDAPEGILPACCPFCRRDELRELAPGVQEELPPEPNREQREPADAALTLASLFGSTMAPQAEVAKTNEPEGQ